MDLLLVLSVIGSIASVIGLLLPGTGWRSRAIHIGYGLFVTVLAAGLTYYMNKISEYQEKINEFQAIEEQAKQIISSADLSGASDGTRRGFMLASLAFLEKHKDRLPGTYQNAKELCENVKVTSISYSSTSVQNLEHSWSLIDGAEAMKALLEGIAKGRL